MPGWATRGRRPLPHLPSRLLQTEKAGAAFGYKPVRCFVFRRASRPDAAKSLPAHFACSANRCRPRELLGYTRAKTELASRSAGTRLLVRLPLLGNSGTYSCRISKRLESCHETRT